MNQNNTSFIMKKFTIAAGIFLCSLSVFSQVWVDAGLKGGYGLDLIANKNFFDDHHFSPKLSTGYMFGGKVGFNFNSNHAVTLDITSSAINQKYTYSLVNPDSSLSNYNRSIGFNSINFLLMYRKSKNGTYFEIGPQYSMITKTRFSDNFASSANTDISADLVKSYYSAVIGFGGYITGTDNFGIVLGCRFFVLGLHLRA